MRQASRRAWHGTAARVSWRGHTSSCGPSINAGQCWTAAPESHYLANTVGSTTDLRERFAYLPSRGLRATDVCWTSKLEDVNLYTSHGVRELVR